MSAGGAIVIVGGGQAGGRAAEAVRAAGHTGPVTVLAAEAHPPYERPPLSKQVLTGEKEPEATYLAAPSAWDDSGVDVRTGVCVRAVDRTGRTVVTDTGERIGYDGLVLATGARPKRPALPGMNLPGVQTFRDIDDAAAVRDCLRAGERVVLVGAGYIGMEIAASATAVGAPVTILEAADGVMQRQVVPDIGAWFAALHRRHGTAIVTGATVAGFTGTHRVTGVELADGTVYPADRVVVGVGVEPDTALAADAGLSVADGIVVDACGRTADPAIVAAGDCTRHWNPALGRWIRLESWQNAEQQARAAAATLVGTPTEHAAIPWFWSDQLGVNLQMVGLPTSWDREIRRGDPDAGAFTVFLLHDGAVVGAQAVDTGRDIAAARRMIERRARPDPAMLADTGVSLKKALKAAG